MPKPQSWQLDPASYPFNHRAETRFADLDLLGHINNVSMAGLFEHGRGMFNHAIEVERRASGQRETESKEARLLSQPGFRKLVVCAGMEVLVSARAHASIPCSASINSESLMLEGAGQLGTCKNTSSILGLLNSPTGSASISRDSQPVSGHWTLIKSDSSQI